MFLLFTLFLGCLSATAVKAQCPAGTTAVGGKFDIKFSKNKPTSNFIIDFFQLASAVCVQVQVKLATTHSQIAALQPRKRNALREAHFKAVSEFENFCLII